MTIEEFVRPIAESMIQTRCLPPIYEVYVNGKFIPEVRGGESLRGGDEVCLYPFIYSLDEPSCWVSFWSRS